MANFSNELENKIVNFFLQNNSGNVSPPGQTYLALFTNSELAAGTATDDTVFAEPTWNGYVRKAVNWSNLSAGGVTSNTGTITFDANSDQTGVTITGIGVYDNSTTLLLWGRLTASKTLENGDTISFAQGAIAFTIN